MYQIHFLRDVIIILTKCMTFVKYRYFPATWQRRCRHCTVRASDTTVSKKMMLVAGKWQPVRSALRVALAPSPQSVRLQSGLAVFPVNYYEIQEFHVKSDTDGCPAPNRKPPFSAAT